MIYKDEFIFIERENSQIPWIKIFTNGGEKELSFCDEKTLKRLFEAVLIAEKTMLSFYKPKKINIASFANYVPRVHFHIMARFEDDDFFPEPMWGKKQRNLKKDFCGEFDKFCEKLTQNLKNNQI
ncbi:HIT family protein [Campylobacter ureolyticus]|uniref:HIT family protein n=1 Tax=Campylobacter ureolyticus TaxID=827 RepID=A0A6N2R3L5_9BACT